MKKIYLFFFAMFFAWHGKSQVLNQNAGWPNTAWTVTGTYNPIGLETDPTTTSNFSFNDDIATNGSDDDIAAESPIINLTAAHTAGEQKVRVSAEYVFRFLAGDILRFEYWNADSSSWVAWSTNLPGNNTSTSVDFCEANKTLFTSSDLDIASFTPTQLSGFKYRIYFNDNLDDDGWKWGFCFNSPTIISVPTPCLSGFNFPSELQTLAVCDGLTPNVISEESFAGDYFQVAVTEGETYKFLSSVSTDFYTLSVDGGTTPAASGTQPLTWVSSFTGNLLVFLNTDITCGEEEEERTTSIICGVPCVNGALYPAATLSAEVCDGTTVEILNDLGFAGEYLNFQALNLNTYTFGSSVATDFITITSADASIVYATGTGSVTYSPTADEIVRMYTHTDSNCGTESEFRDRTVICSSSVSVPDCATLVTPVDGATFSIDEDVILTWSAPTTGSPVTSYDIFVGETAEDLVFLENVTETQFDGGPIGTYNTTIFWQVVPKNSAGSSTGCTTIWSFTSEASPGYCLTGTQYPTGTVGFTPATCDGVTVNQIVTNAFAGEYSLVNVTTGQSYTFQSSVATDFITIGSADGLLVEEFGLTPLTWIAHYNWSN